MYLCMNELFSYSLLIFIFKKAQISMNEAKKNFFFWPTLMHVYIFMYGEAIFMLSINNFCYFQKGANGYIKSFTNSRCLFIYNICKLTYNFLYICTYICSMHFFAFWKFRKQRLADACRAFANVFLYDHYFL